MNLFAGYPKFIRNKSINSKLRKFQFLPKSFYKRLLLLNFKKSIIRKGFLSLSSKQKLFKAIYFYQHQIWSSTALSKLMIGTSNEINHSIYEKLIKNENLSDLGTITNLRSIILYER